MTKATDLRRRAAMAGHTGNVAAARALATNESPTVRATALAALQRLGALTDNDVRAGLADESAVVRRRSCALAIGFASIDLRPLLQDDAVEVVEQAAWALGERGPKARTAVNALSSIATRHPDALCREAAVAALGAVGNRAGLPAILQATTDKPAIRRRAVIALAPFDGPDVSAALERARNDRDWQVRQAAEDLSSES